MEFLFVYFSVIRFVFHLAVIFSSMWVVQALHMNMDCMVTASMGCIERLLSKRPMPDMDLALRTVLHMDLGMVVVAASDKYRLAAH